MQTLWQDLRYGARMLVKNPGFTLIAVLTLALGIGANTAIFSLVNGLVLRPLPYPEVERLVSISEKQLRPGSRPGVSPPNFADWQAQTRSFEQMAAYQEDSFNLAGGGRPERAHGARVSANLFAMLRLPPIQGRAFLPEDERPGSERVMLIGYDLWRNRLGADPKLIGQTLRLSGESFTVIGIMPAGFKFPELADLWIPITAPASNVTDRRERIYSVMARLSPEATLETAKAEMETIAARLAHSYPAANEGMGVAIESLQDARASEFGGPGLPALLGAVGFVLLIACANVANMQLAGAVARRKEIAVRLAVGASRPRLIRQLLTESLLLAAMGGLLGLLVTLWLVDLMVAAIPAQIPFYIDFGLDARVLGQTALAVMASAVLFGLAPALHASKPDLQQALKEGAAQSGYQRRRFHQSLVVAEIALALLLLIGAGLMIRSFYRLQQTDLGYNPAGVLTMRMELPESGYGQAPRLTAFSEQALERLKRLPAISFASLSAPVAGAEPGSGRVTVAGRQTPALGEVPYVARQAVSPDYFRVMETPLRSGRAFTGQDTDGAPAVAIVNEKLARTFWPDDDPLGKQLKLGGADTTGPWLTVVGVVADHRRPGLGARGVSAEAWPELYLPYLQWPGRALTLLLRAEREPLSMIAAVRGELAALDAQQPLYNIKTLEQTVFEQSFAPRALATLFGVFSILALALAAAGIYGLMSHSVSRRTHEIGVRLALGAQARDVLGMIIRQGLRLTLIGLGLGLFAAFALARLLASLLYGVSASDPLTFVTVALLLTLVALLACWIPARRAAKVDPLVALRSE